MPWHWVRTTLDLVFYLNCVLNIMGCSFWNAKLLFCWMPLTGYLRGYSSTLVLVTKKILLFPSWQIWITKTMFVNSVVSYSPQATFWEASEASRERTCERVAKLRGERDSSFPRLCVSVRVPLALDFPPVSLNPNITPSLTLPPPPPAPSYLQVRVG